MRHLKPGRFLTTFALALLAACGGGGGSSGSSSSGGNANTPPTANAGAPQTVNGGALVTLNGSASSDPDGNIVSYAWTQTAGTTVALTSTSNAQPSFTAPSSTSGATLRFALVVTDNRGASSAASSVDIVVNPVVATGNVNVTGKVRFERVGFAATGFRPLDYANPVLRPARGVIIRALSAASPAAAPLATGATDAHGDYTLSVPANSNIVIEVEARMQKTGAAPTWDVRVQDGVAAASPYAHRTAAFGSDAGLTRNIDIPTGVSDTGQATGTRASAPFAVLDTIYTAIEGVKTAAPGIDFPALIIDWGSQNKGTFFSTQGGQHIALLSDLTEDTDEFDQHVIAHEFGHYIEHNFSRADNIGGSHGLGDRLDPRVAFGEGFGYAFAAIVLNDPIARDSFFGDVTPTDGIDNPILVSGAFNVETNPTTSPPGANKDREGCWCSESSVWSILYDLHDGAPDGADAIELGFQPIWNVLVGAQKTTPAFTTIFSFITALKQAQPASSAAIDALVSAQNIDASNIDAFATNETHFPGGTKPVPQSAALPVYALVSVGGGPRVLRTVDDAGSDSLPGTYNKLGNHRFVRFNVPSTRDVTITLATSNSVDNDPDFLVFSAGNLIWASESPPQGPETHTFQDLPAGDYLLDIYDCANGCAGEEGTPGDYDLTLTIN